MYAIARIIYGVPLVSNDDTPLELPASVSEAVEDEEEGFLTYYSGSSDEPPAAFGVELGEFDEACAFVKPADLPLTPTAHHVAQYEALLATQPPERKACLAALGAPQVLFLWSTS